MTRRAALLAAAALALLLFAMPEAHAAYRGTDLWGNLGGAADNPLSGHPLSAYSLDYFVDVGITDPPSWAASVVESLSAMIWTVTTWIVALVIGLLVWAFSLDLINGPRGALQPIADATRALYGSFYVQSVMALAIIAAGAWGAWKLLRHRTEEMVGGLLLSLVCMVLGLVVVFNAQATVGRASEWSNGLKLAGLSAAIRGTVRDSQEVKRAITEYTFNYGIARPWLVLEFGGLRHCVDLDDTDADGFPAPVSPNSPKRDVCRDHAKPDASGHGGYAERFLRWPAGSPERQREYEALRDGKVPPCQASGPGGAPSATTGTVGRGAAPPPQPPGPALNPRCDPNQFAGYLFDKADAPAVDMMQEQMAYQRFGLVVLVALGAIRMAMLFGALALGVVLAQVAVLVLLSLAPLALLAGVIPGRGQAGFLRWGQWLLGALFIGVVYAALVAVVLIVSTALADATDTMGFMWSYGLQVAYFWVIFKKRHDLADAVLRGRHENIKRSSVRRAVYTVRHPVSSVTYGAVRPRYGSRARIDIGRGGDDRSLRPSGPDEPAPARTEPAPAPAPAATSTPAPAREPARTG